MKANTQLKVGIGQKVSFLYKRRRTVVCCTSQCSEVTTIIDTSVGPVVTTTEEGLRESGVCESLLGLRCGRALKNQLAGSSKVMRRRTEAMTWKGVKLYDIIRIRGSTQNKNTD
jgi:hypothetical protein